MNESATEVFEANRRRLFGIAYGMLGSAADAEDVLQDAWIRWIDVTEPVNSPRAYLARTVSNLSLNRLNSAAARREAYVGEWLPEPMVTAPDAATDTELAESISMALLVVMESLSPLERAVFVLKEVFGFSHKEIAGMLDRSEDSVRQVGHRAKSHVQARQPRYDTPASVTRQVTDEFLAACVGGDLNRMMELLAPDVTAWTDGGGKVQASLRPLHGPDHVIRWILGVLGKQPMELFRAERVDVNGEPGQLYLFGDVLDSVASFEVEDGKITKLWVVRNPDKLQHVAIP